jgi:hypothetical protein
MLQNHRARRIKGITASPILSHRWQEQASDPFSKIVFKFSAIRMKPWLSFVSGVDFADSTYFFTGSTYRRNKT